MVALKTELKCGRVEGQPYASSGRLTPRAEAPSRYAEKAEARNYQRYGGCREMSIEIATVIKIAQVSFGALGSLQGAMSQRAMLKSLEQMKADIERLERKTDHLLIRDLLAAYNTLASIAKESTAESRASRLMFAEERLLASTSLEPKIIIEGKSGSFWLARTHYGLAYLAHLRGDDATTALHMLHVFISEPRQARQEIFPHFYESLFRPECGDCDSWLDEEREKLKVEVEDFRQRSVNPHTAIPWRDVRKFLGPLGLGLFVMLPVFLFPVLIAAIAGGGLLLNDPRARAAVTKFLETKYGTPEQRTKVFQAMKEAELEEEYESKIDLKVKTTASELRKLF